MARRKRIRRSRLLLAAMMLGIAAAAVAGCNTVKGVGNDITAVGDGGQKAIDSTFGD